MKVYDKHLPLVNVKNHYVSLIKPWITKGILKSRKTKNKLYRKFLKFPNEINKIIYKRYRNKFNKLKDAAKKTYYNKKFDESNLEIN